MEGKIKAENGIYRVTVAEAVYVEPGKTLKQAIDNGELGAGSVIATTSKLNGKKICFLGDSITAGAMNTDASPLRFSTKICDTVGATEINKGSSGATVTTIASSGANNFVDKLKLITEPYDIIVIMGGANDVAMNVDSGDITSTDTKTWCGAWKDILEYIINNHPSAIIVPVTPIQRETRFEKMKEYTSLLKELAQKYSCPVCDLFGSAGIVPDNAISKARFIPDGTHPNNNGHAIIATRLRNFLETVVV